MAKLYTFGCTFNVVKRDDCTLTDMELAREVLGYMKYWLTGDPPKWTVAIESIHPIMVGPEGGVDIEE